MFTGIVTDMGKIVKMKTAGDSIRFTVQPTIKNYLKDSVVGDSMAINGACMTITGKKGVTFDFTTIKESLSKTNLGELQTGSFVNLEKPMRINAKIDGHIVQGHVDSTGVVKKINKLIDSWEYFIEFPKKFRDNIIYVGSISVNGISLTIAGIEKETSSKVLIKVAIIPHTYEVTNFKFLKPGSLVNLEFDMIGKFVVRKLEGLKLSI
ncbi:MAG TPA: riboflavin synthase [Ignavibacteria bacterium]|nr:riboflavin synthase [Ignavibacteria bacterium]